MFSFFRYFRNSHNTTLKAAGGATALKFLTVYVAILLPFLLLVGYQAWVSLQAARSAAASNAGNLVFIVEAKIADDLNAAVQVVDNVVRDVTPRFMLGAGAPTLRGEAALDRLASQDRSIASVSGVRLFNTSGLLIYSSKIGEAGFSIADREYFQRIKRDPVDRVSYSEVIVGRGSGRISILVLRPLLGKSAEFLGLAAVAVDLEALHDIISKIELGRQGLVVLRRLDNGALLLRFPGPVAIDNRAAPDAQIRQAIQSHGPNGIVELTAKFDGVTRMYGYRTIGKHPLFVGVGIARSDYLGSWTSNSILMLVLSLLFALVLAGILSGLARSQLSLARSQAELRAIVDSQLVGILKVDDRKITWANAALADMFGYSVDELIGLPTRALYVDDADWRDFGARAAGPIGRGEVYRAETRSIRKNGDIAWVRINCSKLYPDSAEQIGAFVDITDLHETRSALAALSHEQEVMLDNDLIGIVKISHHAVVWVNKGLVTILGYSREETVGMAVADIYPDRATYDHVGETAYLTLQREGRCRTQTQLRRKDGSVLWVDMTGVLLDESGETAMWLVVDITQVREYQEKVEFLAYHDSLTGLPNRLLLSDRLIQSIALAERHERSLAVCYIDLDGFKDINDRYGHGAGDRLLVEVARRLQVMVRVNDTVCRVGGDEFVLVLTYLDTELDYVGVLHRVIAEIGKPIALGYMDPNKIGEVSASIGVALYPADGRDADALIRHADQAMYQAKQRGRKQVCTYAAIRAEPPTSSAG